MSGHTTRGAARLITVAAVLAAQAAAFTTAVAQSRADAPFATRPALLARVAAADSAARSTKDRKIWEDNVSAMTSIRERLKNGDFNVGDRIVLRVSNVAALTDTFVVRGGRVIELPDVGQIPLSGVLWAELTPYLTTQIGKYVVNPTVEAHPLLRVQVSGAVSKPGYYVVRPDMLVSDAIMSAGGPTPLANVDETSIKRGGKEIIKPKKLRDELASGATVDQLDLRAGDEIYVGEKEKKNWAEWLRTGAYVAAIAASLYGGRRLIF